MSRDMRRHYDALRHQSTTPQNEPNPQRAAVQDVPGVKNFLAKDSCERERVAGVWMLRIEMTKTKTKKNKMHPYLPLQQLLLPNGL